MYGLEHATDIWDGKSTLSDTVGEGNVILAKLELKRVAFETGSGHVMNGGTASLTLTKIAQEAVFEAWSVELHVTFVSPAGKAKVEGTLHAMVGIVPLLSLLVGKNGAWLVPTNVVMVAVTVGGHTNTGGVTSRTITYHRASIARFPDVSATLQVTGFEPSANEPGEREQVTPLLSIKTLSVAVVTHSTIALASDAEPSFVILLTPPLKSGHSVSSTVKVTVQGVPTFLALSVGVQVTV